MVKNIADFERGYTTFDIAAELRPELEFNANIVILAIGENVKEPTTEAEREEFSAAFRRLLELLQQWGKPAVFVRSCFWPSPTKDGIMRQASRDTGASFVDISALAADTANAAGSERTIAHRGVAAHPGNTGMQAIADALLTTIRRRAAMVWPTRLIGYTQLRTNLTGGRHANVSTMRASLVKADGADQRQLAAELVDDPNAWTQFAGWSPSGATALVLRGWQSPENAKIEQQQQGFRFSSQGWLLDTYLVDIASGRSRNVTAVDRVSFYNGGLFFWPGDPSKLGFTALIDGNSHPFKMDSDGHHKTDLTSGSDEFTYGFSSSRDGRRIAYHKNYQIFLADADGGNAVQIQTGQPFNFSPTWSPDGKWVLFVSGQHHDCHPTIVRADGTGLKKLADRGGYRGVVEFLDVPDFHGGSSDVPVWSPDSKRIYYTAKSAANVELFTVDLEGVSNQLTSTADGTLHYHPEPSPCGDWLLYGSKREHIRQLYVMRLIDGEEKRITNLAPGHAAMWPHWQPLVSANSDPPVAAESRSVGVNPQH